MVAFQKQDSFKVQAAYAVRLGIALGLKEKTRLRKTKKHVFRFWVPFIIIVFTLAPVAAALAQNNQKDRETKQRLEAVEKIEE